MGMLIEIDCCGLQMGENEGGMILYMSSMVLLAAVRSVFCAEYHGVH